MTMYNSRVHPSPIGDLTIIAGIAGIRQVRFPMPDGSPAGGSGRGRRQPDGFRRGPGRETVPARPRIRNRSIVVVLINRSRPFCSAPRGCSGQDTKRLRSRMAGFSMPQYEITTTTTVADHSIAVSTTSGVSG